MTPEDDVAWILAMVAREEECGASPPNGASGGAPAEHDATSLSPVAPAYDLDTAARCTAAIRDWIPPEVEALRARLAKTERERDDARMLLEYANAGLQRAENELWQARQDQNAAIAERNEWRDAEAAACERVGERDLALAAARRARDDVETRIPVELAAVRSRLTGWKEIALGLRDERNELSRMLASALATGLATCDELRASRDSAEAALAHTTRRAMDAEAQRDRARAWARRWKLGAGSVRLSGCFRWKRSDFERALQKINHETERAEALADELMRVLTAGRTVADGLPQCKFNCRKPATHGWPGEPAIACPDHAGETMDAAPWAEAVAVLAAPCASVGESPTETPDEA